VYTFVSAFVRANQVRLIAEASSFQLNSASLEQEATHVLCGSVAFSLRTARTCCHSVLTRLESIFCLSNQYRLENYVFW
jgi:hypothetical protein